MIFQKWFLVHGLNNYTDVNSTKWIISPTYTTQNRKDFNGVSPKIWLEENKPILTNRDGTGCYIFIFGKVYKQQYIIDFEYF